MRINNSKWVLLMLALICFYVGCMAHPCANIPGV
jgi:hypothetical protein